MRRGRLGAVERRRGETVREEREVVPARRGVETVKVRREVVEIRMCETAGRETATPEIGMVREKWDLLLPTEALPGDLWTLMLGTEILREGEGKTRRGKRRKVQFWIGRQLLVLYSISICIFRLEKNEKLRKEKREKEKIKKEKEDKDSKREKKRVSYQVLGRVSFL